MAREIGPQAVHVAHVIIDGGIDGEKLRTNVPAFTEAKGAVGLLDIDAIADLRAIACRAPHRVDSRARSATVQGTVLSRTGEASTIGIAMHCPFSISAPCSLPREQGG